MANGGENTLFCVIEICSNSSSNEYDGKAIFAQYEDGSK